ncbi:AMP-binding protein, partial [Candidatus Poribacteria bacterium]
MMRTAKWSASHRAEFRSQTKGRDLMYDKQVRPTNDFAEFKREEIEQSVPERFEKIVTKYGDRLAVKDGSHELKYDELNERANRIARAILERRGEGQEPVALLLPAGASMISGALGVLKSGNIYMPLASWFPRARNDYMLKDSLTSLIVTDSKNLQLARELAQDKLQLVNIDELDSSLSMENLNLSMQPEDIASIRYTSGSTGQPKGVFRSHRNSLYSSMRSINDSRICIHDRMASLGLAGVGSPAGIFNGASSHRLDIREEGLADLANWLIQLEITICTFVVTAFRHFVDTLTGEEEFPNLRLVRFGAEPVYKRDVELFMRHFPSNCILLNQLGTTETGHICRYFIDKDTQIDGNFVPVGYVVPDKE